MGRLVYLNNLDLDARWYFPDAHYNRERNNYNYTWPNIAYPSRVAIHSEDLDDQNSRRIEIRKWIEENLQETVICDILDKSYRRFTDSEKSWEHSYEVSNRWVVFYFDNEHSASIFALRFSEWIKPITDENPRWL
jgi:hypothetical protein